MNHTEVANTDQQLAWIKSSHSGPEGGDCVEVAASRACVHVRDSKQPDHATLTFTADDWSALVRTTSRHRHQQ
jgi:hypothetical protein